MTGKMTIAKIAVFTLLALVFLGFGGGFRAAAVSAHVGGDSFEIFRGQSDAFEVTIDVSPRTPVVGPVHFTVKVSDSATANIVTDARILIVVFDEEDAPTIQTLVLNTPLTPDFYEGNLTFELPARYTLRVDLDSPTFGSTSFRAPFTVRSGTPIENPLGTWIFLLVTVAIIGGTVYVGFSAKKAQRRRATIA